MASTINRNEQYTILGSTLQDICDSVSEKTGVDDIPVAQLPKKIAGIGGLAYEDIKDVMFMDYNGDVLYSYDKDDFIANVDELPVGPIWHDNLTFQEWNWTLADIKDELQNGSGACCIGAHYTTKDSKTHLYINLTDQEETKRIQFYIQRFSGTITVDWGDGSSTESFSGTAYARHTYANYGKYDITVSGGSWGMTSTAWFMRGIPLNDSDITGAYYSKINTFLERVEIATNCIIPWHNANVFTQCINLKSVSIHKDTFQEYNQQAFNLTNFAATTGLRFFAFPKSLGSMTTTNSAPLNNAFIQCPNLISVSYPKGFKYLQNNPFNQSGLSFFYFPAMTTWDCGNSVCQFQYCFNLKRVAMKFDSFTTTYSNGFYGMFMYSYNIRKISFEKMKFPAPNRYYCYLVWNLQGEVVIPSNVTVLTGDNFSQCRSVTKYTFLGDVTTLGVLSGNIFGQPYSCMEWDFTHCTSVPSLYSTNCFTGIRTTAKIKVPASLESAWKTATNWSTYASYIVGV